MYHCIVRNVKINTVKTLCIFKLITCIDCIYIFLIYLNGTEFCTKFRHTCKRALTCIVVLTFSSNDCMCTFFFRLHLLAASLSAKNDNQSTKNRYKPRCKHHCFTYLSRIVVSELTCSTIKATEDTV